MDILETPLEYVSEPVQQTKYSSETHVNAPTDL